MPPRSLRTVTPHRPAGAPPAGGGLGLGVAAHRAEDGGQSLFGAGRDRGAQRVRRPRAGREFGRVAGLQAEADAAIVEVDPRRRLHQPRSEAGGVGLDERHRTAAVVHRAQVGGVAGRRRRGRARGPIQRELAGATGDRLDQRLPVGVRVQIARPIPARGHGGLDQHVRPRRIGWVGGKAEHLGDPRRGQQEVVLRVRRQPPQRVPPDVDGERRHPVGGCVRHVGLVEDAAAELDEAATELSLVERVATVGGDRPQRAADPRAADPGADGGRLADEFVELGAPGSSNAASEPTSNGDAGKPASARRIAGASSVASGSEPNRSCSATHPLTQPGTVTETGSCRNGISRALADATRRHPRRCRRATGVQRDHAAVVVDEREEVAAHAAQPGLDDGHRRVGGDRRVDALPPRASTPMPAEVASWSAQATIPPSELASNISPWSRAGAASVRWR